MARLTTFGQNYIAQAVGNNSDFIIDEFIFAHIPDIDHTMDEPITELMPDEANIVYRGEVTQAGVVDANRVTFSKMLLSDIGDFEFNWLGIAYQNQLVMFGYVPQTKKIKDEGVTKGNVITRNMVIEHLGIANTLPVQVLAESWMFDFTVELNALELANVSNGCAIISSQTRIIENAHDSMRLSERLRLLEIQQ